MTVGKNHTAFMFWIVFFVCGISFSHMLAQEPIWSKQATSLDLSCSQPSRLIPSPDHRFVAGIYCHKQKSSDPIFSITVKGDASRMYEAALDEGAHELLWASDSRAFFIDGSTSAYAGFFVTVYQIDSQGHIRKETVTHAAQKDVVMIFPPCNAANISKEDCARIESNPEYNMSGLAWADGSSAIDVFAEVPCSSSYGGIMCQIQGYELSVPDGKILKRYTPSEMNDQWRAFMAWKMRVPDAPIYRIPALKP
jgi:hypothetical protein